MVHLIIYKQYFTQDFTIKPKDDIFIKNNNKIYMYSNQSLETEKVSGQIETPQYKSKEYSYSGIAALLVYSSFQFSDSYSIATDLSGTPISNTPELNRYHPEVNDIDSRFLSQLRYQLSKDKLIDQRSQIIFNMVNPPFSIHQF